MCLERLFCSYNATFLCTPKFKNLCHYFHFVKITCRRDDKWFDYKSVTFLFFVNVLKLCNVMFSFPGLNVHSMLKHETLVLTVSAARNIEERILYHLSRPDLHAVNCERFRHWCIYLSLWEGCLKSLENFILQLVPVLLIIIVKYYWTLVVRSWQLHEYFYHENAFPNPLSYEDDVFSLGNNITTGNCLYYFHAVSFKCNHRYFAYLWKFIFHFTL